MNHRQGTAIVSCLFPDASPLDAGTFGMQRATTPAITLFEDVLRNVFGAGTSDLPRLGIST